MKPYDKVSSFRGANTLFQKQQNKNRTQKREHTERRRSPKENTEEITEERPTPTTEDGITGDRRTRAEEPGPLRDATSEGQRTL
jgi:hypothetical protein